MVEQWLLMFALSKTITVSLKVNHFEYMWEPNTNTKLMNMRILHLYNECAMSHLTFHISIALHIIRKSFTPLSKWVFLSNKLLQSKWIYLHLASMFSTMLNEVCVMSTIWTIYFSIPSISHLVPIHGSDLKRHDNFNCLHQNSHAVTWLCESVKIIR